MLSAIKHDRTNHRVVLHWNRHSQCNAFRRGDYVRRFTLAHSHNPCAIHVHAPQLWYILGGGPKVVVRDAPFDIWGGGGGARLKLKKIVCRHESQKKKVCWKCEQKKKKIVEIDEKYVDQKKHQMVTYIIGKAYDKKFLRRNIKKKLLDVDRQKKSLFSTGGKKKSLQATKTLGPPPPDIKWCVP